jgi:hypothetical protein
VLDETKNSVKLRRLLTTTAKDPEEEFGRHIRVEFRGVTNDVSVVEFSILGSILLKLSRTRQIPHVLYSRFKCTAARSREIRPCVFFFGKSHVAAI